MLENYMTHIFHAICLVTASVLIGRSIYHYALDEDLTFTPYREFHSGEKYIYPSISLCFGNVIDEAKLNEFGVNSTTYMDFLKGHNISQDLSSIPYEKVTLDPMSNLLGVELYQKLANRRINKNQYYWYDYSKNRSVLGSEKLQLYVDQFNEYLGTPYKCLISDIPYIENEHLNRVLLVMKKSIFQNSKRPRFVSNDSLFMVSLAYPNQRIRFSNEKVVWPKEIANVSYAMKFYLFIVEAMQYRNKNSRPCNTNWKEDDNEIRKKIISNVKCVPSYWQTQYPLPYPRCSSSGEMRSSYIDISWNNHLHPCRILSKTSWHEAHFPDNRYDEKVDGKYLNKYFTVKFYFPQKIFKEIELVQAFDIETMIGNGGGYIGLCLGYSFLQFPAFLYKMKRKLTSL